MRMGSITPQQAAKQLAAQEEMTTQAAFALPLVCIVNPGACVVVGIGILRVCKTAINVIKQLTVAGIAYETYNCAAGGSCSVAVPTAESLTRAHKDAAGDKTKPGYGGQCKPDQFDDLDKNERNSCKNAKGSCNDGVVDLNKAEAYKNCAAAREDLAKTCFMGGNDGHTKQIKVMLEHVDKCTKGVK